MSNIGYIVVNFGGPRDLQEVYPFLRALLTDEDVIHSRLPSCIRKALFSWVAKRRSPKIAQEYAKIGGGSSIFTDTEWVVERLRIKTRRPVISFHRYIENTHHSFIESIQNHPDMDWRVFPLFPQFSYVTTGSVARWLGKNVPTAVLSNMRWVKSYATHPQYIEAFSYVIEKYIEKYQLEKATLLFSAHGLPIQYIEEGDPYQEECQASYKALRMHFSSHPTLMAYQSQFGKKKWLEPSTAHICAHPHQFLSVERPVLFIPLSFSSDHIETLYEIEGYCAILRKAGYTAYRCPALGKEERWVEAIQKILDAPPSLVRNDFLIRR